MKVAFLAAALAAVTGVSQAVAGTLVIAERGKVAEYSIVVPPDAPPSQGYAAEELRDFVEKTTGVRLPIVSSAVRKAIVLETNLRASASPHETSPDAFRLCVDGNRLRIVGGSGRGVLYGVYEVLERFAGCRWYASWHTVVPRRDRIVIPVDLDETHVPAFAMREPFWFDVLRHPEFAARLRVNSRSRQAPLGEKFGGDPYRFGGGLVNAHTFGELLPSARYFDEHPEYFALVNGRRVREMSQPCLTNPDVLRVVTSNVLERIRRDPGAKFYGVSQNDCGNRCQCPDCLAVEKEEGSPAGPIIRFVNAIADEVGKEFPDALIETLAYSYSQRAPKKTRPRRNVVPCLCSIHCDFASPIEQSPFEGSAAFRRDIEAWGRLTDFLYVWDYTTDFAHYTMPWANVYSLQGNLRFFRRNNVKAIFAQGAYQGRHADFAELKAWLLAKWMWDPDMPAEQLLDDFFAGYYGAGAPFVRECFEKMHRAQRDYSSTPGHPLRVFDGIANPALSDSFLAEAARLWRMAEEAVKDDPATSYNVRMGAFSVDYLRMERGFRLLNLSRKQGAALPPNEARALARSLLSRMEEAGDIRLAEPPRENIVANWRAAAEMPDQPNCADSGELEERLVGVMNQGTWGDFVDDPMAGDGRALKLFNTHYQWCVQLPLSRIAFEPGAKYTLRVRVRVDSRRDGMAFSSGVYATDERKSRGQAVFTTGQTPNEYAWYDILTWTPGTEEYVWMAPGAFGDDGKSSINGVYLDKIAFVRAD